MAIAITPTITRHVHRSIFPHTDHGYTWVECYWYERDGRRFTAISPCGGCCERLGNLPGGPLGCPEAEEYDRQRFAPDGARTIKTEETHEGMHRVDNVSIVPV